MFDMYGNFAVWVALAVTIVVILIIFKTAVIVPQQSDVVKLFDTPQLSGMLRFE